MDNSRLVLADQQPAPRTLVYGTKVGNRNLGGPCLIIIIVISSIFLFTGLVMAIASSDEWKITYTHGEETFTYGMTAVRKTGIVFVSVGGFVFLLSAMCAWKSYQENRVIPGYVIATASTYAPSYQGVSVIGGGATPGPRPSVMAVQNTSDYLYSNHQ